MQKNNLLFNSLLQSNKRIFTISSASLTTCVLSINDFYHVLIIRKLCGISEACEVETQYKEENLFVSDGLISQRDLNSIPICIAPIVLLFNYPSIYVHDIFSLFSPHFCMQKQPKITLRYYYILLTNFPCDERIYSF